MLSIPRRLIDALGEAETRAEAARSLARCVGAHELLLFVTDPELGEFLPAPGMPQTLRGAAQWRAFLRRCSGTPSCPCELEAGGQLLRAVGVVVDGCGFVLAGEAPCEFPAELLAAMPLIAAAQRAQHAMLLQSAAAREAREASAHAHELARALDAARAQAAEMNRRLHSEHEHKDQFLAMLAHELRNPLAPVTSGIEVLRRLPASKEPRVARQLDMMGRQLQQLTHLVDDLLDVSRVSRGLIELRTEPLLLRDVIAAAIESARPLIASRGHAASLRIGPEDIHVKADPVRLMQVFANLLNNAAKYTPPGGEIWVEVEKQGERVEVRVGDNGSGIPPEMLSSIFELFTQVPGSLDRAPGGLGIGLTLVRTLVQLHGGDVRAQSDGPGTGSTFVVTLPVTAPPPRKEPKPVAASHVACASVMIVDDNADAAHSLAEVFNLLGTQAAVAHDGAEALAMAERGPLPEVALLDIGLPGIDGYEVAREWRRRFGRATRLIALTGYGSPDDRRRTAQAGFDAHLVKPVALEELTRLLSKASHTSE